MDDFLKSILTEEEIKRMKQEKMYIELRKKWTCYICSVPAPDLSLESLEIQERSKNTEIFVDGEYRIYLRCPECQRSFHAVCATYEIELHITKEATGTLCEPCADGNPN